MFLSIVFQKTPDIGLKKQAAERLVEICKVQQRNTGILEYADFLVPFANQEENQGDVKSQLTEQYKNYSQRKQDILHQQERRKNIKWTMTIIGCLLVLLSSIAILYYKNRIKKQLSLMLNRPRLKLKVRPMQLRLKPKQKLKQTE
jgi:hypothetical protein